MMSQAIMWVTITPDVLLTVAQSVDNMFRLNEVSTNWPIRKTFLGKRLPHWIKEL
jgi:hypothetical protein